MIKRERGRERVERESTQARYQYHHTYYLFISVVRKVGTGERDADNNNPRCYSDAAKRDAAKRRHNDELVLNKLAVTREISNQIR